MILLLGVGCDIPIGGGGGGGGGVILILVVGCDITIRRGVILILGGL